MQLFTSKLRAQVAPAFSKHVRIYPNVCASLQAIVASSFFSSLVAVLTRPNPGFNFQSRSRTSREAGERDDGGCRHQRPERRRRC